MEVTKDSIFVLDKTILRRTSMAQHSKRVVYPDSPLKILSTSLPKDTPMNTTQQDFSCKTSGSPTGVTH